MANKSQSRAQKLQEAKRLYYLNPEGITDIELSELLHIERTLAWRVRKQLGAKQVSEGRYTLEPSEADIQLALAIMRRIKE